MKTIRLLALSAVALAGLAISATPALAADPVNAKCPLSGKDIDPEAVSTYAKLVGFCCEKCKAKFEKDPVAFVEAIAKVKPKAVNMKCPASGEDIDPEQTSKFKGLTVGFCCEKCKAKFDGDPDAMAEKIKKDNPANEKCVVSGEDIDAEVVAVFSKQVGFCCTNCQGKFDKEPDKHIAKALAE